MADEILKRDQNFVTVLGAITDDASQEIRMVRVDPVTNRILASTTGSGTGSVTDVSVVSANGFAGSVATSTTTPAITLTTSITGILKGNGTAISAVTIGSGLSFDGTTLSATGGGSGTVTSVSVTTANGVSGSVATATTTPAITLTLGAITPTSVNGLTITANGTNTLNISAGKTVVHTAGTTFAGTDGKTLTISNSITLAGTDGTVMTFPSTSATIARTDAANTFTGVQTFSTPIAATSVATMTATVGGGVPTPPNNTTTFLRGDGTFATPPSGSSSSAKTIFPLPNGLWTDPSQSDAIIAKGMATNTIMFVGQVVVPFGITANKITIRGMGNTNTAGTVDLTLYAEDGQSQIFSVTSGTIDAGGQYSTSLSAVSIPAGVYYLGVNTNGTADISLGFFATNEPDGGSTGVNNMAVVSSEPTTMGQYTITASTPPATITLSSITYTDVATLFTRLDN